MSRPLIVTAGLILGIFQSSLATPTNFAMAEDGKDKSVQTLKAPSVNSFFELDDTTPAPAPKSPIRKVVKVFSYSANMLGVPLPGPADRDIDSSLSMPKSTMAKDGSNASNLYTQSTIPIRDSRTGAYLDAPRSGYAEGGAINSAPASLSSPPVTPSTQNSSGATVSAPSSVPVSPSSPGLVKANSTNQTSPGSATSVEFPKNIQARP